MAKVKIIKQPKIKKARVNAEFKEVKKEETGEEEAGGENEEAFGIEDEESFFEPVAVSNGSIRRRAREPEIEELEEQLENVPSQQGKRQERGQEAQYGRTSNGYGAGNAYNAPEYGSSNYSQMYKEIEENTIAQRRREDKEVFAAKTTIQEPGAFRETRRADEERQDLRRYGETTGRAGREERSAKKHA